MFSFRRVFCANRQLITGTSIQICESRFYEKGAFHMATSTLVYLEQETMQVNTLYHNITKNVVT